MRVWEILLIGCAIAADEVAVSLTDGMTEKDMRLFKAAGRAGAFALFQFVMPLVGYCCGALFSAFVASVAPALSFCLLLLIGGMMIFECFRSANDPHERFRKKKKGGAAKLLAEAFATSIDALAVGVTLLAAEQSGALPFGVLSSSLIIGAVTFVLSFAAALVGKRAGAYLADQAGVFGGVILIFIGVKILIGGF